MDRRFTSNEWIKLDRLAAEYARASDKAAFLADVWGDLTAAEGTELLRAINQSGLQAGQPD